MYWRRKTASSQMMLGEWVIHTQKDVIWSLPLSWYINQPQMGHWLNYNTQNSEITRGRGKTLHQKQDKRPSEKGVSTSGNNNKNWDCIKLKIFTAKETTKQREGLWVGEEINV